MKYTFSLAIVASIFTNLGAALIVTQSKPTFYQKAIELEIDEKTSLSRLSADIKPHKLPSYLEIISGPTNMVTIKADPKILDKLTASVIEDELRLDFEIKTMTSYVQPIHYKVQLTPAVLKTLRSITTTMDTTVHTPITCPNFSIELTGERNSFQAPSTFTIIDKLSLATQENSSGDLHLANIAAKELHLNHSGQGTIKISKGHVKVGDFTIAGNGRVDTSNLHMTALKTTLSPQSFLHCYVYEKLFGTLFDPKRFKNWSKAHQTTLPVANTV